MIRLHTNVAVLRLSTPMLREELEAVLGLERVAVCPLSDQVFLVEESVVDDLAAQLSEKGYMPRIEEAR